MNPEKQRECARRYRKRFPEKARARDERWRRILRERCPEKLREYARRGAHRRRARKLAATIGPIPPDYVEQLRGFQGDRCPYCHEPLPEDYHVDHVIPLSRGGAHAWENLVLACPACNMRKGSKMPADLAVS